MAAVFDVEFVSSAVVFDVGFGFKVEDFEFLVWNFFEISNFNHGLISCGYLCTVGRIRTVVYPMPTCDHMSL